MGVLDRTARAVGRYLLYGEIASGGMATVHFGRLSGPAGFSRTVAIKQLHPHLAKDPELVAGFIDEARLAARIRHPNVVPTLEVVAIAGEIFLVMEYVEGETLSRLVRATYRRGGHVDPRILATIMSGVLHGLHAAHEAADERGQPLGIVHRDVSPQNILVGVDGVARVLDFGVAKAVARLQTTRAGEIKGKLAYMAPERLFGSVVTRQADVYAAAVVTWEALTGKRLFKSGGDTDADITAAILNGRVAPPSELAPHAPAACDSIVSKGLAHDLEERYATALEMALDLEKRVGIASPFEVGQWVQDVAAEALAERTERVRSIETSSGPTPPVEDVMRSVQEPSGAENARAMPKPSSKASSADGASRRVVIGLAAATAILIALSSIGIGRLRAAEHATASPSASAARVTTPPTMESAETLPPPEPPPPAIAASAAGERRAPSKAPATSTTSRKPTTRAPSAAPTATCVLTIDEKGKHWNCP